MFYGDAAAVVAGEHRVAAFDGLEELEAQAAPRSSARPIQAQGIGA